MPDKTHYFYDPELCDFVPIKYDLKEKVVHSLSFWLINGLVLAIVAVAILSHTVGTPAEIALKDENRALIHQLERAEESMISIEDQLSTIQELDNNIYRSILGLEPPHSGYNLSGTGGTDMYADFDLHSKDASDILRSTANRLDRLERRIGVQEVSFQEIKNYYNTHRDRLSSIPAIKPVNGIIISGFRMRVHPILRYKRMHEGIDFRADIGSEVFATGDGVVKYVGRNGNYGRTIEIDHGFGFVSRYTHLSGYLEGLGRGDTVKRGDLIGFTGESGLTEGPHLHYEILVDGRTVNPLNYLIADVTPEEYHYFKNSENRVEESYTLAN